MPVTPQEVQDFVPSAKATLATLTGNDEARQRAIEDLTVKLQSLQERAHNPQVANPVGGNFQRFLHAGAVNLKSKRVSEKFAGFNVSRSLPGLFDSAPVDEWHHELLTLHSGRHFARTLMGGNQAAATPILDAKILNHLASAPNEIRGGIEKAISDTASSGAEWIPDNWSPILYQEFYTLPGIDAFFDTIDIAGPTIIPSMSDVIRPYLGGKVSSDDPAKYTPSTPTSGSTSIEPVRFSVRTLIDTDAVEDAIIPLLPMIQACLGRALRDGYEDAMINGDSTATHEDTIATWNTRSRWGATGLGGAADHRRAFKGFRRIAFDRSATTDQSAGQTVVKVMEELLGGLGERGSGNALILTSPEVYFKKMLTDSNLLTVDKAGAAATILNGQLGMISGVPVVLTRWLTADLATTGKYTGTGAKSGVLAVSRDEFRHYRRRDNVIEVAKDITIGGYNLVATRRSYFGTLSGSSSKVATFGFNWL
jgi:hypothetical protein